LSTIAEIFFYVEEKGMEMEVDIREAYNQAAFMLSALRELRADGRELKKKQNESETDGKGSLLGPLLGPAFKEDKGPAPPMPDGFIAPENLEFIGLELDLPVGFRRLRWAFTNSKATFITEAVFKAAAKYEKCVLYCPMFCYRDFVFVQFELKPLYHYFLSVLSLAHGQSLTTRLVCRRYPRG
jgi:hypothetical protein